jgi:hypothetical protein
MRATLLALPFWSIVLLLGLFLGSTALLIHWVSFMPANRARAVTLLWCRRGVLQQSHDPVRAADRVPCQ